MACAFGSKGAVPLDTPDCLLAGAPGIVTALIALNLLLFGCTLLFLAAGFFTRWARARHRTRRARFAARWEPLLHGRVAGDRDPLPALKRGELLSFLMLWLHLAGYVKEEGKDGLRTAGTELNLGPKVIGLLAGSVPWQRLLAARAAALLRLAEAVPHLTRMAAGPDPRLALAAVEALLTISPAQGHDCFRQLVLRSGWSPCAMAAVASAHPAVTRRVLEAALAKASPGGAMSIVRLLELIEDQDAAPALRLRLAGNRHAAETAALLHALGRFGAAEDRRAALPFLRDARWLVRMQAASALGGLGLPEDLEPLAHLLSDPEWWVRYRAAQAMLRLARGDRAALAAVMDKVEDRFARDAMSFAVAEFEWVPAA